METGAASDGTRFFLIVYVMLVFMPYTARILSKF